MGMRNVKALYSGADLDPVLFALEFQEYMQENREYYDELFSKLERRFIKINGITNKQHFGRLSASLPKL